MDDKHYVVLLQQDTLVHADNEHGFYATYTEVLGVAPTMEKAEAFVAGYKIPPDDEEREIYYEVSIESAPAI